MNQGTKKALRGGRGNSDLKMRVSAGAADLGGGRGGVPDLEVGAALDGDLDAGRGAAEGVLAQS